MTNPNQNDAQLSHLSDDYIRNLEPENQRYDITLAQDFVISVLPNGIKTWAFIYDFQGRHRRKTLGVFPEMNFEDAKLALEKARASMLRMDEPTVAPNEFGQLPAVLGGGRYIPKKERTPFNWLRVFKILGALVVLVVLAGAAVLAAREWERFSARSATAEPTVEPPKSSLPFTLNSDTKAKNDSPATDRTASTATPFKTTSSGSRPASANLTSNSAPAPGGPSTEATTRTSSSTTAAAPQTDSTPAAPTRPASSAPSSTGSGRADPATSSSGSSAAGSRPVTTLTTTTKATAFGGRVSRSRLTSKVQDLEPVDTLGPEISYKNSGFTRVFYFTELREFSDGTVVHRWSLNGEPHEEVVLNVRKSWRWRTYSNKDLTPGLNGEWKVETIDATGKVLDSETFTYDYQ